jgi:hypothetical protein
MRRVRTGELISGAAAAVLLVSTFLDWYSPRAREQGLDAWQAFSVVDLLLAVVILLGLGLAFLQVVGRGPALPVAIGVATATLAIVATVLVAYRIVNQPGPNDALSVSAGAWLGLVSAAGVALGAWWSLADERPRPVDPPAPPPERRPTPARS